MPTWAATLLVGFCTVLTNLIVTAFYFGKLAQRVESNEKELDRQAKDLGDKIDHQADDMRNQWGHIGDLRADMGKVKGKLGVNGA
jgi:hypothetical protein